MAAGKTQLVKVDDPSDPKRLEGYGEGRFAPVFEVASIHAQHFDSGSAWASAFLLNVREGFGLRPEQIRDAWAHVVPALLPSAVPAHPAPHSVCPDRSA